MPQTIMYTSFNVKTLKVKVNQSINRSLSVTLLFLWVSAKLFCFVLSEPWSETKIKLAQIFLHRP